MVLDDYLPVNTLNLDYTSLLYIVLPRFPAVWTFCRWVLQEECAGGSKEARLHAELDSGRKSGSRILREMAASLGPGLSRTGDEAVPKSDRASQLKSSTSYRSGIDSVRGSLRETQTARPGDRNRSVTSQRLAQHRRTTVRPNTTNLVARPPSTSRNARATTEVSPRVPRSAVPRLHGTGNT